MADGQDHNQSSIERIISVFSQQNWLGLFTDVLKVYKNLIQRHFPKGMYEVLEYESTLELIDQEGNEATFRKR